MGNFVRALRLGLRRRAAVAGIVVSSLVVAVLWGANLGLVQPLVEVVFSGKKPHAWFEDRIAQSEARVIELRKKAEEQPESASRFGFEVKAEQRRLDVLSWVQPYVVRYCPNDSFRTLMLITGVLVVATFVKDFFLTLSIVLVERLALRTTFDLRADFFRRTLRLDAAAFGQESASRLMSRFTNDLGQLNVGLSIVYGKCFLEPFKMAACLFGAALICWRLLLFTLIVTPIAAFLIHRLARAIKRANRRAMEEMSQIFEALAETFSSITIVKAFTSERRERRRFHRAAKNHWLRSRKIIFYSALSRPAMEFLGIAIIGVGIIAGGYLVLNGQTHLLGIRLSARPLEMSSMIAFFALLAGAADPARKLSDVFNLLQSGMAAADRIYQAYDREPNIQDPPEPKTLPARLGEIAFRNVEFSYVPGTPVLHDVSFTIPSGETWAIVGSNGCGKSTLANLLLRFYDPDRGSIALEGLDLREIRMRDFRRRIGFVNQQAQLFDDTVLENIRYGSPHASDAAVMEAAKQALAHSFITEKLEDGYATRVGERGSKLSGGQRQRIALARVILRDPEILILDEATSQIDVESEQMIHRALERFRRGRTTLIITHRISALELADRVVVMDHGRIASIGTFAEVARDCEVFRRLYAPERARRESA